MEGITGVWDFTRPCACRSQKRSAFLWNIFRGPDRWPVSAEVRSVRLTADEVGSEALLCGTVSLGGQPGDLDVHEVATRPDGVRIVSVLEAGDRLSAVSGERTTGCRYRGIFATPMGLVHALEASREGCRLFVINAQGDWPQRFGLIKLKHSVRRSRDAP